jgi:hypothetical protein
MAEDRRSGEKLKGPDVDAETVDQQQTRRQQPGAQGAGKEADAIDESGKVDEKKLEENRRRMGVAEDHKTEDMKKGGRGTYP